MRSPSICLADGDIVSVSAVHLEIGSTSTVRRPSLTGARRQNFVRHIRRLEEVPSPPLVPDDDDPNDLHIGTGMRTNEQMAETHTRRVVIAPNRPLKVAMVGDRPLSNRMLRKLGLRRVSFIPLNSDMEFLRACLDGMDKVVALGWHATQRLFRHRIPHFPLVTGEVSACQKFLAR